MFGTRYWGKAGAIDISVGDPIQGSVPTPVGGTPIQDAVPGGTGGTPIQDAVPAPVGGTPIGG